MPSSPSRPLPERIGPYLVRSLLGSGGMGVLYLAVDPRIDRQVALKVLRTSSPEFKTRFLREARAAGRLSHPNIVTIFDVGDHDGQPYIAMEYVPGKTLRKIIDDREALSQQRRLTLAVQLCDGLGFAHRAGIVHRDIKPANLMVARASGMLKILDFGIARSGSSNLTQSGVQIGTLNYMSPEQARGQVVDHRSDIFAVGLVLYELLTFTQAFPGEDRYAVIPAILDVAPQPLAAANPDLDAALQQIVSRALEKSPDARYADLRAMQSDITRVLQRVEQAQAGDTVVDAEAPQAEAAPARAGPTQHRAKIMELRARRLNDHVARASAALDAQDLDGARHTIDEATILDLDDPRVLALVARLQRMEKERRAAQMLDAAEQHFSAGDLTAAIDLVDDALRLTPRAEPLLEARRRVEQAVALRERDRAIARALEDARTSLLSGAIEPAMRAAREVLAMVPSHPDALALLAQGDAQRAARRVEQDKERRVREAIEEALADADQGRLGEALARLEALDPGHQLVTEAAALLRAQRDVEVARAELHAWSNAEITGARGCLEAGAADTAKARLEAMQARLADPAPPGLADDVGRARLRVSRELDMAAFLTRARERLAGQDPLDALACLDALLVLDPSHATALALRTEAEQALEAAVRQRHDAAFDKLVQESLARADQAYGRGDLAEAIARVERLGSDRIEVVERLTRWRSGL